MQRWIIYLVILIEVLIDSLLTNKLSVKTEIVCQLVICYNPLGTVQYASQWSR